MDRVQAELPFPMNFILVTIQESSLSIEFAENDCHHISSQCDPLV
jgi:hypothetical protein